MEKNIREMTEQQAINYFWTAQEEISSRPVKSIDDLASLEDAYAKLREEFFMLTPGIQEIVGASHRSDVTC